jgi:hypothetical protein
LIHSSIAPQTQADIRVLGKIDDFFSRFKIISTLHRCGIRKGHGHSVRSLIMAIFTLPFVGKNFFRGIVINGMASWPSAKMRPTNSSRDVRQTGAFCCFFWVLGSMDSSIG